MSPIRPQLRKGIIILTFFFLSAVAFNIFFPEQINISRIQYIPAASVVEDPIRFEGMEISSVVHVIEILSYSTNETYLVDTTEGLILLYSTSLGTIKTGDLVYFRGISLVYSMGHVEIFEIHIHDRIGPVLRSIPGIILFIGLFFSVFTFDFHKLAFVIRREHVA